MTTASDTVRDTERDTAHDTAHEPQAAELYAGDTLALLLEVDGAHAGQTHPMQLGIHVLGRAKRASIVIDDPDVSRRHAELRVTPGGVWLRDCNSKNGVLLADGRRLSGSVVLEHGHRFQVGDVTLEVQYPSSRVFQALQEAGEFTMTRFTATRAPRSRGGASPRARRLVTPLVATVLFAALSVLLWMS